MHSLLKIRNGLILQPTFGQIPNIIRGTSMTSPINFDDAKNYKQIPKPNTISFFLDFIPGGKFYNGSFYDYASAMRQRYGDIFIMPGLFGKPDLVMLFDTKDIETVFRNEGQWPNRPGLDSVRYFREHVKGDFFGEKIGLPVSNFEQWGKTRSAVNPILMKPRHMDIYLKPLQNINDEFITRIKSIRDPKTLEVPDNFEDDLNRMAFESVSLIALNREMGLIHQDRKDPNAERLFKCSRLNFEFAYKLDIQPSLWKLFKTPDFYKSMKNQEEVFNITHKYIEEALQQLEKKSNKAEDATHSVLETLLVMDKKLAVVMAMDMLFAGVDGFTVSIAAILLCLAKNPQKQRKLLEEILEVLPTKNSELDKNSMKNLSYLRAVIKEAMRFYPNGTGPLRTIMQDLVLAGYKVPKGSAIVMNSNILVKDEKYFSQANEFVPERWLRDENNKKVHFDPFSFMPFGVGSRICVGKRLAEMEMEVTIMKLIRSFNVEFDYDASKPFKANFINVPSIPLKFKFTDIEQ